MTLTLDFQGQILKKSYRRNGMAHWNGTKGMWVDRMLDSHCDFKLWPHPWPWPWIFKVKYGRFDSLGMKGMWVGYDVGCTMGLTCGHGAWQIDRQSSGSMWNSYSFQPVGQWMSYSFTDLGAEGCCRSLNALLYRFVRRRRPQILVHAITFEQLFAFLSFLARLLALTCRLPD